MDPLIIMLAGPNGVGKTTFFNAYLSHLGLPYLNTDNLAKTIQIEAPEALRQVAEIRNLLLDNGDSFIYESDFSDPLGADVEFIHAASNRGYETRLLFIGTSNRQELVRRVDERARSGEMDAASDPSETNYTRALENLDHALRQLPDVLIYDNSTYNNPHRFIAEYRHGILIRCAEEAPPQWARSWIPERILT